MECCMMVSDGRVMYECGIDKRRQKVYMRPISSKIKINRTHNKVTLCYQPLLTHTEPQQTSQHDPTLNL